jgi:cysteinyl-tRNA synthetase
MKIQNTLTRTLDEITPLEGNKIKLYTCGLTVYSQPHIGNWVAYIYWDVLVRTLKDAGFDVTRVQNITDVGHLTSDEDAGEDKMLKGALKEGLTAWQVAEKYIAIADDEAYNQLGLLRPDHMPRATAYIPQQIAFVEELEKKGYTYKIKDGVYFDTSKLSNYGDLARLDIDGLQFGARVEDTGKKNPTDFAVWKFSDPAEKRDMEWESPWGIGFPGWHLECSVMAREILGDQIDIHTGGIDHIPVHHTNEIAQTEAVTGKQFSTYWMHNNHLKVDGEKMSKSLGNIHTLQDIIDRGFEVEAFKMTMLSKHYRTEGNFTWDILEASQNRLQGYRAMADQQWQPDDEGTVTEEQIAEAGDSIKIALNDDLNTPLALAALSQLEAAIDNGGINTGSQDAYQNFLIWVDGVLGLTLSSRTDISDEHKRILADRQTARDNKDWATSDNLRSQLAEQGILVKDTSRGQTWSRI